MTPTRAGIDFDPAIEKKLLGWLIVALLIVALMAAAAIQNNARQAESAAWVNHTHAFILETDGILSSLHAAEAAQRTFLLTGDDATKQLAVEYFARVDEHLKVAAKLAFQNPGQKGRLATIAALLQRQIDLNKDSVQLRGQDPKAAAALFTTGQARTNVAQIEIEISTGKAEANQLLHEREQKLTRHTARTEQILYAGAGLNLLLLGFAFYVVRMDLNLRRKATEILEAKVAERTAELAAANEKLQIENLEQKWGQAALARVVRHHELIFNSMGEAVFVISRNGRIISSNRAAADLVGIGASELAARPIASIIQDTAAGDERWENHFLSSHLLRGDSISAQPAFLKAGAGMVAVRLSCQPTRDQENLTGAVVTLARTH